MMNANTVHRHIEDVEAEMYRLSAFGLCPSLKREGVKK